jgi:hypothetical protein
MSENRRQILQMLSEGKITADEAERLIAAVEKEPAGATGPGADAPRAEKLKYLRVVVDAVDSHDGPTKVNVRVPMQLLRAGVRLTSFIPPAARERMNSAMKSKGIDFDVNQLKPENLEDLIEQLNDFTVDIDHEDAKVRVFCE